MFLMSISGSCFPLRHWTDSYQSGGACHSSSKSHARTNNLLPFSKLPATGRPLSRYGMLMCKINRQAGLAKAPATGQLKWRDRISLVAPLGCSKCSMLPLTIAAGPASLAKPVLAATHYRHKPEAT